MGTKQQLLNDHERFKNISSGVQSLVIACAVVIGGVWTAYVFDAQLSVENARAQLQKLQTELSRRPVLDFELSAKQISVTGEDDAPNVFVTITIRNSGNSDTRINWEPSPIFYGKIQSFNDPDYTIKSASTSKLYVINESGGLNYIEGTGVRVGEKKQYQALFRTEGPGVYLITFRVSAVPEHIVGKEKILDLKSVYWTPSTYVIIK